MQVVDEDDEDPPGGVVGRARRRQDDARLRLRRRRQRLVVDAAAVGQHERHDFLLDAVFVDLELVLLQIGDELAAVVADDDVGRDDVDLAPDHFARRLLRLLLRALAAARGGSACGRLRAGGTPVRQPRSHGGRLEHPPRWSIRCIS